MSVKEDLFEAIIGAVALDSDWDMEELQEVIQIMLDPGRRIIWKFSGFELTKYI